jgi:hypothetical protein
MQIQNIPVTIFCIQFKLSAPLPNLDLIFIAEYEVVES